MFKSPAHVDVGDIEILRKQTNANFQFYIFSSLILLLATKMLQFVEIQKAWILTLFELIIVRNFCWFKYYCPPCRFVFWRWWKVELTLCCRKYNLYRKKGDLCSCFLVKNELTVGIEATCLKWIGMNQCIDAMNEMA